MSDTSNRLRAFYGVINPEDEIGSSLYLTIGDAANELDVQADEIEGPALISFSGGRTSGYMLRKILDAHGGTMPDDVLVSFQNTGREMPETLDFIQECATRWGVHIIWLEWRDKNEHGEHFEIVSHNSASRNGEPFKGLVKKRKYLPNPVQRFCTGDLKIKTMHRWAKSIGLNDWTKVLGLRYDESRRVANSKSSKELTRGGCGGVDFPLYTARVSARDVVEWWRCQNFDLGLPSINNKTPLGNCDLCFLKGAKTVAGIARMYPERAAFWASMEDIVGGATFRSDRPSYNNIIEFNQGDFFADMPDDDTIPCMCTD